MTYGCPQGSSHRWVWIEDVDGVRVSECVRCGESRSEPLTDPELDRLHEIRSEVYAGHQGEGQ